MTDIIKVFFVVLLILELLLAFINRKEFDIESYFLWYGIVPTILSIIINIFITVRNTLKIKFLKLAIMSLVESLVLVLMSYTINLYQLVKNTRISESSFTLSISIDPGVISNFITTFFPIFFISIIGSFLVSAIFCRKVVN